MISEPVNPIAAHLGGGVIQVFTEPPVSGVELRHYEVVCSRSLNGTYRGISNRLFPGQDGFIYGFTTGTTSYLRIRAIGIDDSVSEWVQVQRGQVESPSVMMRCRAVVGSIIPAGALFTCQKNRDRILGFVADQDIEFTL